MSNIRNIPNIAVTLADEIGGLPRDPAMAEVLDQFWPECYTSEFSGKVIMSPADTRKLEDLFELFGVPLKVADNSLEMLGHAYDVFAISLARFVNRKLRHPDNIKEYLYDWPSEWIQYVEAVAAGDRAKARTMAVQLQPLAPECPYPNGMVVTPLTKK